MKRLRLPRVMDEAWLWGLDQTRLDRPKDVVRLLERAASLIEENLLPLLYAVCGAAFRQLDRLAEARWAYHLGEEYAEDNPAMVALITQRRAWIDAADGKLPKAITQLRCAAGMFTELGDRNSVGKTLVDRGIMFGHAERLEHSTDCMVEALTYLVAGEFDYRFAAFQGCAVNDHARGKIKSALSWLEEAKALLPMCAKQAGEKLWWMNAQYLVKAGKFLEGAAAYLEIEEAGRKGGNLIDAALAKAEAARALLAGGDFKGAAKVAESLDWFIFRVSSETAQAALIDVSKAAAQGQLASGLLSATQTLSRLRKKAASRR